MHVTYELGNALSPNEDISTTLPESCQENAPHRLGPARCGGPLVVADYGELAHAESQLTINVRHSHRLDHLSYLNPDTVAGVHDSPGRETDAIEELPGCMQQLFARAIA